MRIFDIYKRKNLEGVVKEVVSILRKGGIIIYPTETVYGIGGLANIENIKKVNTLKGREPLKPIILLILPHFLKELVYVSSSAKKIMDKYWPGPVTILLPKRKNVDLPWNCVGVRFSPDPFVRSLLSRLGEPILSTSANITSNETIKDPEDIIRVFGEKVDAIVVRGRLEGKASTIVKCEEDGIKILRGELPASFHNNPPHL